MKFIRLFEFEDLPWFPAIVRQGMTDYLGYLFNLLHIYQPVIPLIVDGLKKTNADTIIDLCSGGGGPIEEIQKGLSSQRGKTIKIILTDKFPNIIAFKFLAGKNKDVISYSASSIDATDVPFTLKGFRIIFSAFHHFNNVHARLVIKNAVNANCGIGIFDGDRNIFIMLSIIILHPVAFIFLTPFIRPFRLSRIVFTYLIPVIPFCTIWDGIVSITRLRSPEQLLVIAKQAGSENYTWKAGKVKTRAGLNIAYLTGYPKKLA